VRESSAAIVALGPILLFQSLLIRVWCGVACCIGWAPAHNVFVCQCVDRGCLERYHRLTTCDRFFTRKVYRNGTLFQITVSQKADNDAPRTSSCTGSEIQVCNLSVSLSRQLPDLKFQSPLQGCAWPILPVNQSQAERATEPEPQHLALPPPVGTWND